MQVAESCPLLASPTPTCSHRLRSLTKSKQDPLNSLRIPGSWRSLLCGEPEDRSWCPSSLAVRFSQSPYYALSIACCFGGRCVTSPGCPAHSGTGAEVGPAALRDGELLSRDAGKQRPKKL